VVAAQTTPAEAVFVVGASRSGTTLMRNLLERSDQLALARETHFLGHLVAREGARYYFRKVGDPRHDETLRRIVELIYSGDFQRRSRWREVSPFWRWLVKNVPREEMQRRLLALPADERTERGMMAAFLRVYADTLGRPIMGEKTPAHLAYVDTLLEWFPSGRVIHIIRDPRAVFVSDLRRRRARLRRPYSWFAHIPLLLPALLALQTTLVWRDAARRHFDYVARYPDRYRLVRFEDVVRQPMETLPGVFAFLGVPMPPDPTAVRVYSRGYQVGKPGLDAEAADRWRQDIGAVSASWLSFALGGWMRRLGYGD
jgi:hypothetical protein